MLVGWRSAARPQRCADIRRFHLLAAPAACVQQPRSARLSDAFQRAFVAAAASAAIVWHDHRQPKSIALTIAGGDTKRNRRLERR